MKAFVLGATAMLVVGLTIGVSENKIHQVDEVEHVHVAYNMADGRVPFADFWQAHPPALWGLIRPVVRVEDPVGSFERSRTILLLLLLGHLGVIAYCGARLAGPLGGFVSATSAGLHSTMIERGIEIRPDGPTSLLVTTALAVELSGQPRRRRFFLQGLLLGTAGAFSQKAVLTALVFAALWTVQAVYRRDLRLILLPLAGAAIPMLAMVASLALSGSLAEFWDLTVLASARAAGRTQEWLEPVDALGFILWEAPRNPVFLASALLAVPIGAWWALRDPRLRFPVALAVGVVAALWVNPFPFPYLHVTVIPAVAIVIGTVLARAIQRWSAPRFHWALAGLWVLAVGAFSVPRLLEKTRPAQHVQYDVLEAVEQIVPPGEPVFDLAGLHFRPDPYPVFVMTGHMIMRYRAGGFPSIPDALRESRVAYLIDSYRLRWPWNHADEPRAAEVIDFIESHYVHLTGNIMVLGAELAAGETRDFVALREAEFRYDGPGVLLVDGEPFTRGMLTAGVHRLESEAGGRLLLSTPEPWPPRGEVKVLYNNLD